MMFGAATKKAAAYAKLRELQAAYDALDKAHAEYIKDTERLRNRAYLADIQREGRTNKFIFARNGEMHVIETMGMWADSLAAWKRDLLE